MMSEPGFGIRSPRMTATMANTRRTTRKVVFMYWTFGSKRSGIVILASILLIAGAGCGSGEAGSVPRKETAAETIFVDLSSPPPTTEGTAPLPAGLTNRERRITVDARGVLESISPGVYALLRYDARRAVWELDALLTDNVVRADEESQALKAAGVIDRNLARLQG